MIQPFRVAWVALKRFLGHSGPDRAAAVAYYTLLSLLPMLIFVVSVGVAILGSFETAYDNTVFLFRGVVVHLDDKTLEALRGFAERAVRLQWPGILLLAWTARRAFGALFGSLEIVFEVPSRGFARGNLLALGMVMVTGLGMLLVLVVTTVIATAEGVVLRYARAIGPAGLDQILDGAVAFLLTRILPALLALTFFFLVYRVVPRKVITNQQAFRGAFLATILWELAKAGFSYYVRNLAHYAGLYGTLEGVLVLALWLELSASIVLYGGEVVAVLTEAARAKARQVIEPKEVTEGLAS